MTANITDMKRFAVHDGDGIRTTVFFKGCPLKCVWCHNPETIKAPRQIGFYEHKCTLCGKCAMICPCHTIENGKHLFDRKQCVTCGKCVRECLNDALISYGKEVPIEEICEQLLEDKAFYEQSGGGITLSGGECLLQPDACLAILKAMKEAGVQTAVDTCGCVPCSSIEKVMPYTDVFLYDLKAIDEDVHINCTGMSNKLILENLKKIDEAGGSIEIRYPYVPDYNSDQAGKICAFIGALSHVVKTRVLACHNFARSKYNALSFPDTLPPTVPEKAEVEAVRAYFREHGVPCRE